MLSIAKEAERVGLMIVDVTVRVYVATEKHRDIDTDMVESICRTVGEGAHTALDAASESTLPDVVASKAGSFSAKWPSPKAIKAKEQRRAERKAAKEMAEAVTP